MNSMKAQLKKLSSMATNPKRTKRKFYCWSCGRNFTHVSKTCSTKKMGHKEESYYKKRLGGIKKGCKRQLRATMDKIEIRNPKISLINCIGIPPNYPSKNMLEIADAGANIHLGHSIKWW